MRHVTIVTDAWHPQVNGVVRTLSQVVAGLINRGNDVSVVAPSDYRNYPCPTYPEIRLAFTSARAMARRLAALQPTNVHIATEGPLGLAARRACIRNGWSFTTSFHTRFPEYLRKRAPVPVSLTYRLLSRFHNASSACLVPTPSIRDDLSARGFARLRVWTRGVDRSVFKPRPDVDLGLPKPVFVCVGRVAPEKNLEAFLALKLPGTKLVVGDGPGLERLKACYPDAVFLGKQVGEQLARTYAGSDVFVFPSRTDTFGLVLLEAIASGLPVAAFPVPGPMDVVPLTRGGVLDEDLAIAAAGALAMGRLNPDDHLGGFTWDACLDLFEAVLAPANIRRTATAAAEAAVCP